MDDMILGKGTFLPRTVKMTIDIYVQSLIELLTTVLETDIENLMDSIKHSLYTYLVLGTEYLFQKKPNRLLLRKKLTVFEKKIGKNAAPKRSRIGFF